MEEAASYLFNAPTLIWRFSPAKVESVAGEVREMTQAATRIELAVKPREVLGKKVKRLRREDITPANIYGNGIASLPVQVPTRDMPQTIRVAGPNTMLQRHVEGE